MYKQGDQKEYSEAQKAADTKEKLGEIVHTVNFSGRRQTPSSKVPPGRSWQSFDLEHWL
jgi:hypothetical protein